MLRSTGWFSRSTWTTTRPWSWSRRQQTKGMHYRLIVINFYELNSCHLTVSVGSTKLLTDCTGSKWCETLLKRTPVTHSSGKLTGGARTKHWKINCILFLLESNDSGRFQMKKRAVEELKNDHLKNIRLRALPMMVKKRWVVISFKHNWLQCVSSTDFSSKTSFQDVFRCISWFGKYIIIILWK